jgi:hypothetical protein
MESSVIKGLGELFSKGFIQRDFEVSGYKFTLKTLNEKEAIWRDRYTDLSVNASFLSSRRVPTLAISIKAINDEKVEDLFEVEQIREEDKSDRDRMIESFVDSDLRRGKYAVAEKVMNFLSEAPPHIIDELWSRYQEIETESRESLNALAKDPDFFRADRGGELPADDSIGSDEENELASNGGESRKAL